MPTLSPKDNYTKPCGWVGAQPHMKAAPRLTMVMTSPTERIALTISHRDEPPPRVDILAAAAVASGVSGGCIRCRGRGGAALPGMPPPPAPASTSTLTPAASTAAPPPPHEKASPPLLVVLSPPLLLVPSPPLLLVPSPPLLLVPPPPLLVVPPPVLLVVPPPPPSIISTCMLRVAGTAVVRQQRRRRHCTVSPSTCKWE